MSASAEKSAEKTEVKTEKPAEKKEEVADSEAVAVAGQRTEIFIRGLAFTTRELTLARHIETVAPVKDVHILMTYNNRSKGSAFVHLEDPSRIDEVVEKLNGKPLEGRFLEVARAKPFSELPPANGRRHFAYYYPPYPPHPPRHYSYYPPRRPYVRRFPNPPPAPVPAEPEEYHRRKREPNPERTQSQLTVAVLNLPYVAKEDDMSDIFEGFTIVNPKISRNPSGMSKGVAFVTFLTHEDQQRAIATVNSNIVENRKIHVVEAFLLPEDLEEERKSVEEAKKKNSKK